MKIYIVTLVCSIFFFSISAQGQSFLLDFDQKAILKLSKNYGNFKVCAANEQQVCVFGDTKKKSYYQSAKIRNIHNNIRLNIIDTGDCPQGPLGIIDTGNCPQGPLGIIDTGNCPDGPAGLSQNQTQIAQCVHLYGQCEFNDGEKECSINLSRFEGQTNAFDFFYPCLEDQVINDCSSLDQ